MLSTTAAAPSGIGEVASETAASAAAVKPAWVALGILVVCYGFNTADRQLLMILQEPMARELHLSDSALGSLGVFFAIAYGVASFPLAAWADRGWARPVIAATLASWSVMTIACGTATSFLTLGLGRAGVALGEAGCAPAAHSLIARRFPAHLRATAMGILLFGAVVGLALSAGIGGWIAQRYGWRAPFFAFGAAGLLATPLVWYFLGGEIKGPAASQTAQRGELGRVARAFWGQKSLRFLCVAGAATAIGGGGVAQWIGSLLIREHGLSVGQAGGALLVAQLVGGAAGAIVSGLVTDAWGKRDGRAYAGVPAITLLLGVAAPLVLATAPTATVAVTAFGYIVFMGNAVLSPVFTLVQKLAPKDGRATAAAFIILLMNLVGMALGPLLFGLASDLARRLGAVNSLNTAVLLAAGAFLIGALAAVRVMRSIRADLAAYDA
jgi:predicted MFS family arabinose efflux permease